MFHGVVSGDRSDVLTETRLRRRLETLGRSCEVVPLAALRERLHVGGPRPPVALTFDDDLASHVEVAAPLLRTLGLPATFFLTGASLNGPNPFWWQDLHVLATRHRGEWPATIARLAQEWPWLGEAQRVDEIADTIEELPLEDLNRIAGRLREMAADMPVDKGLLAGEVAGLARQGFEIGFHTRSHRVLTRLDDDGLAGALSVGLDELTAAAGPRPTSIAYPHCRADLRVAAAARAAGFICGVTCSGRGVSDDDHPLLLGRIDGDQGSHGEFMLRLARAVANTAAIAPTQIPVQTAAPMT
jgi:peptidoglycan/xylan/chitin deacetylase (PgdA/CDA1 family)